MLHNTRHRPPPRKPEITRHEKRKRVTVIAGFQCLDALLICADTEQGISQTYSKSQIGKIESFISGGAGIAIGGAGDGDLIAYVQHELKQRFDQSLSSPDAADVWMQSFARDIWNECVEPYRGFATELVPDASFLIGLQMRGVYSLYKWERNTVWPIPRNIHTSIGIGVIQSEPLLAELQDFSLPAHQMLLYAVRAMLRVKQLVQGCGGKTEAVLLLNDGTIMRPAIIKIDLIEYLVEEMDRFLLKRCAGFIAGHRDQEDLNEQTELLKRFKQRYEKIVPDLISWYRDGEIRF